MSWNAEATLSQTLDVRYHKIGISYKLQFGYNGNAKVHHVKVHR